MTMPSVPSFERLNGGRPILQRVLSHPWENRVVFNPASILVEDRSTLATIIPALPFNTATKDMLAKEEALCFLLYRAQGALTETYDFRKSSLGLAVLSPRLELLARYNEPLVIPDKPYENLGVEDARISKIGDRFVMTYTAYASVEGKNRIRIALASSSDLVHWEKHGLLRGRFNEIDNKNAMFFPEMVHGKFLILHRPMEGNDALSVHWAEADDPFGEWTSRGMLIERRPNPRFVDTWVGGGAPPIRLQDGRFLMIYHIGNKTESGGREYDFALAVADPRKPEFVVRRDEPFVKPETEAETLGDVELGVNNVVFVCGAHMFKSDVYIPYAGADSVVLGGCIRGEELQRYLLQR